MQLSDKISGNLTGGHIQEVLDFLMHNSIQPIVLNSDVFDIQLIALLSLTARNKKRKLSSLSREDFISKLSYILTCDSRVEKFKIISSSRIERGFIYNFVVRYLEACEGYDRLYYEYLTCSDRIRKAILGRKMAVIEDDVGTPRDKLYSTIATARSYLEKMYEFRNSVVEQYLKHSYVKARKYVKEHPNCDLRDVYQNFNAAVTKSVDKYDCSKGALTSYVDFWIRNAENSTSTGFGHEYGIAYSLPQQQKEKIVSGKSSTVNFSISLNQLQASEEGVSLLETLEGDVAIDEKIMRAQEIERIRRLAKLADPKGIARLYLDIDEHIDERFVKQMQSHMEFENGVERRTKPRRAKTLVRMASSSGSKEVPKSGHSPEVGLVENCKENIESTSRQSGVRVRDLISNLLNDSGEK